MKLTSMRRGTMAAMGSLAIMLGLTACTRDYVVSYLYVTSAKSNPGVVNQYAVDYQTGALTQIGTPPQAGNNPVAVVAAPNGMFVYVINQGDSSVQEFAVQVDGSLVSKNVYKNTAGSPTSPVAASIDGAGKFLYVAYTYFSGSSGVGAVSIYPINGDNSLGTATTIQVGNNPIGIVASAQFCQIPAAGVSNSNPTCTTTNGGTREHCKFCLRPGPRAGVRNSRCARRSAGLLAKCEYRRTDTRYGRKCRRWGRRGTQRLYGRRDSFSDYGRSERPVRLCDGSGDEPTDRLPGSEWRHAKRHDQWPICGRTLPGRGHGRSARQVSVCCEL